VRIDLFIHVSPGELSLVETERLDRIEKQLKKILMTLQEAIQVLADENVKLDDIGTKLTEGFNEITALIGQLQNTTLTSDQQAIVDALKSKVDAIQPQAQSLADIVPGP
jgi:hypothetical protein